MAQWPSATLSAVRRRLRGLADPVRARLVAGTFARGTSAERYDMERKAARAAARQEPRR